MMKILHVIPAVGSVYGGPSVAALSLCQSMAQQGIQVDIVTTDRNGRDRLDVTLQTWIEQEHYRIQYFPCWYLNDYKISLSLTQWLLRHIRDYDIVNTHAIFSYSNLPAHWACQRYQVPYVMNPHGMLETWALAYKSWKKNMYYTFFEKPALQKASAIRVLVLDEAASLKRLNLQTSLTIVPNGIWNQESSVEFDAQTFYQQFPKTRGKTLILFLGRIDPKKGLDLLATAFGQVHQQFLDTHLIVAGPDNIGFLPTAKTYFEEVGCADAVTFTGMLTGISKQTALTLADLYVAPSYSEGFSMSVLEGMNAGLPCIITTGCNFPEAAMAEAAHVVDIDAAAIAQALIHCLKYPNEAKAMGDRARQFVLENYTWDKIATQMIEVYQSILDRQPA